MEINGMGMATTVLANSSPQSAVGLMMLNKAMDTDQVNGDLMTKMLERSVNPMVGQNIDIRL
ncbi:MAG: putative motility protein [Lachnospiraceae bacterium]|nr:putative motility protein [Lachnospiraceae bacterium]